MRVSAQRREALLDEFERSGLSGVQFAQRAGVKYPTFAAWVPNRRRKAQAPPRDHRLKTVPFIEAVADGDPHGPLTVELGGVARIQVRSPLQLNAVAELIGMLGACPAWFFPVKGGGAAPCGDHPAAEWEGVCHRGGAARRAGRA